METYLALGTNLGSRAANLRAALLALVRSGVRLRRVSPVVESPAVLPADAEPEWNKPYLNVVVRAETNLEPIELLRLAKRIEHDLGRAHGPRWAPRPIDIDILLYGDRTIAADDLIVPHPAMHERAFVLAPLACIDPGRRIPGRGERTILEHKRHLPQQIPLWMGIVNLTPDSFSDGGRLASPDAVEAHVAMLVDAGAHIIDLGAESTRPGAVPLTAAQEWSRLAPTLETLTSRYRDDPLRPRLSVDTYHAQVAERALTLGVDIINDVGGLSDPAMIELAASHADSEWVAMHQLTLPADPARCLPSGTDPIAAIDAWLAPRIAAWHEAGIDSSRLYLDPGIGFGKSSLQSLCILQRARELGRHGLRTLIGHSRKSFMSGFTPRFDRSRDLATLGASLQLIAQGVDVLRVHDVPAHAAAYLGWAHLNAIPTTPPT